MMPKNLPLSSYFIEFLGIIGFVLIAGLLTVFFENPDLSRYSYYLQQNDLLKRLIPALGMGIYITIIAKLAGDKTGAQINPAATLTFYRLKKMNAIDAMLFIVVQFAGALVGVYTLSLALGNYFSHPKINFANSQPQGSHSHMAAFFAELTISFLFMYVALIISSSKTLKKFLSLILGMLIFLFVLFETPLSGMSLNPARSFAAALASGQWTYLWIYFVAPLLGMFLAAELFILSGKTICGDSGGSLTDLPVFPKQTNK